MNKIISIQASIAICSLLLCSSLAAQQLQADCHVWYDTSTGACQLPGGAVKGPSGHSGTKASPYWASVSKVVDKKCGDVFQIKLTTGATAWVKYVDTSNMGGLEVEQAGWKKICPYVDANGSKCRIYPTKTIIPGGPGMISCQSGYQPITVISD